MKKSSLPILVRKTDYIIFGVLAAVAVICLVFFKMQNTKGDFAEISIDGKALTIVDLKNDDVLRIDGIENVEFEIKNGKISIKSSDCADKVCEKTGFISDVNESIVCLPKKLTVVIKSENDDIGNFDGIVG